MRAAVYHGPRDVRVESVPDPGPPGPGELVLEVLCAAICGTDVGEYMHGPRLVPLTTPHPASGHVGPVILGHEMVGRIVAQGPRTEPFEVGQRVVPGAGVWCGECDWCRAGRTNLCARYYTLGFQAHGGLAERVKVPARMCHPVPPGCSDESAALAQPAAVAIHAVRRAAPEPAQWIALIGVGSIGSFILAALRAHGLGPVIAVDVSDDRLEVASRLGAAHRVNAVHGDPETVVREFTGEGVHLAIEASGAPSGPSLALSLTRRGGRVLLVGLQAEPRALDLHSAVLREVDIVTSNAHVCDVDLPEAVRRLATSTLGEEILDRVIPLEAVVADGLRAMAEGRVRGKVVVRP
jgi:(R,R)-butanediol dehydrogenase/meso-butanediol dehydrogenase/diacetyl reductase